LKLASHHKRFSPIVYDNKVLEDGGVLDLITVSPLKQFGYKVIGINIMPSLKPKKYTPI